MSANGESNTVIDFKTISVIIVNFNSGPFLRESVSHLKRCRGAVDIIVVDNASTDLSAEFCHTELGVQFFPLDSNIGFGAACNLGAKAARGQILLFLNPDCFPSTDAFEILLAFFEANQNLGACGGLLLGFDGREQSGGRRRDPTLMLSAGKVMRRVTGLRFLPTFDLSNEPLGDDAIKVDAVSGACLAVRESVFRGVGGFDEAFFLHFEDLDLCRSIRRSGFEVRFVPQAVFYHYQGASGGLTSGALGAHKARGFLQYFRKYSNIPGFVLRALVGVVNLLDGGLQTRNSGPSSDQRPPAGSIQALVGGLTGSTVVHIVLGARSDIGEALIARLSASGVHVLAVSRRVDDLPNFPNVTNLHPDFLKRHLAHSNILIAGVVTLCPIWELPAYSDLFHLLRSESNKFIGLSSTSITTKNSAEAKSRSEVARRLQEGERWIESNLHHKGVPAFILRPTLVFGGRWNRNINAIKRVLARSPFRPRLPFAVGLRNPIHADDLAEWIMRVLGSSSKLDTELAVVEYPGGEPISFDTLLARCADSVDCPVRTLRVNHLALRCIIFALRRLPTFGEIPKDFVDRLAQDFTFTDTRASLAASVEKRRFRP